MSILDQMRAKQSPDPRNSSGGSSNPMEAMLMKMLAGVGLDAGALQKVQTDIAGFARWMKDSLTAIFKQNEETHSLLKDITARLERIENDSRGDGK